MMTRVCLLGALWLVGCLDPGEPGNLVPKTVAEDPDLPHIAVAGTRLHSEAFGDPDAPMVMVLHGGPGGDYRGLLPLAALADDGYYVVFWDQRGTGLSERHDPEVYTEAGYLEDLRLVIEHYTATPTQPFVFIGHSWGAMYATYFINEHGDYDGRLRGAILSEPGAFTKRQLEAWVDKFASSIDFLDESVNDGLWSRKFLSPVDHARADYLRALLYIGVETAEHNDPSNPLPFWRGGAIVNAKLLSLVDDHGFDWTTDLAAFRRKVLFLRGDLNTAQTAEHQRELAASYPDAETVTMTNVGHEMIWERPEEYLAHVRDYFEDVGFEGVAP